MKKRRAVRAWLALVVLGGLCACQGGDPGPRGTGDEGDAAPPDGAAGVDAIPAPPAMPFVTDAQGRVLILHGANVVGGAKSSPYYPQVTREQILRLSADWGFNFARVLILWAGVEPAAGTIDEVFLDRVEERLDWFHEAGILVLLDMHQDVYSEFTCGDGAPLWAVRTDDLPIRCPAQWFLGYFEPGVQRAFDNFWDATGPHADLQERYVAMWVAVAERFRDHPAVMGYDLMNEPHPGTAFDIPEALGMGAREDSPSPAFDRERLQPFYQRLIDAIRTVDSDRWIAFEPRYGAPGNGEPAFFTDLTDPRSGPPRLLYAPHLYSVALEAKQAFTPETDTTVARWEAHRMAERELLGAALVAGEWGLDPSWENARVFMRQVLDMADRSLCGWAYWAWDPGGWSWIAPDGSERETADDLVRAYPRRIAGIPASFSWDADARVLDLAFTDHPAITGPTEIYLPARRFFPEGWELLVDDPPGTWSFTWDPERELVLLTVTASGALHHVRIGPAR